MQIDTTITLGNVLSVVVLLGGMLLAVGAFKQRTQNLETKVEGIDKKVEKIGDQVTTMAVVNSRLTNLESEVNRLRERMHDCEAVTRASAARQQGLT